MPRSRGRPAPASHTQTRSAHTMSRPAPAPAPAPVQHAPAPVQTQQPGLFSQMATTAAGVAVGSAVGHTLANGVSSIFGGGSSSQSAPVDQYQQQPQQLQATQSQASQQSQGACDMNARSLTDCLDQNNGDMRLCQWYADQLKSCLDASKTY